MTQETFQQALAKLVTDPSYRSTVESDPDRLTSDYSLDPSELEVLQNVWAAATGKERAAPGAVGAADDVSLCISPCCCCCA